MLFVSVTGIYERFVQDVYKVLNANDGLSNAIVQHDVKLKGISREHQIDVYWQFSYGTVTYRVAVECKDYKNPVTAEKIEAFRSTLLDIGNDIQGIFASRNGFQTGAILEKDKTLSFYRECFQQVVGIRSSTMDWGLDANPEEGRLNEEQEIEQISTYLNFYRTNVCFLPKVIPEDIVYDEEYLKKICGAQLFPNLADARDSKEKLFRIANALSLPIGGIEQLLITQFIIKKGEDYQKISELLHMIAEQH